MRHTYIKFLASLALLFAPLHIVAQETFTSEFAPYEMRQDAESGKRTQREYYLDFTPKALNDKEYRYTFELPEKWSDRAITLHLEGIGSAFDLAVNGKNIVAVEDSFSPTTFDITPYITKIGANNISVILRGSHHAILEQGVSTPTPTKYFDGSYITAHHKVKITDYTVSLTPDPTSQFGILDVAIQVHNGFNFDETIEVGYDIYDPAGKLHEFSTSKATLKGGERDTVTFRPYIYGTYTGSNLWSPANPKLYRVMLYVKRNNILTDYIPLRVGFGETTYKDGKIMRFGKEIEIKSARYNATTTKAASATQIKALKAKGVNTLRPDYPQPLWFYELCDEVGMWVIDQLNINSTQSPDNRKIGGTPANNPKLLDEYMTRAKRAYFRGRNFNCIIGYSLGGETSGNGYNMQKLYRWFKGVESKRPIIYTPAGEEWNNDNVKL